MESIAEFEALASVLFKECGILEAELVEDRNSKAVAYFDSYEIVKKHMREKSVGYAIRLTLKGKTMVHVSAVVRPYQILGVRKKGLK